ncbi:hypothetical protein J6590_002306 [Homalodisca vitripennis]|nr:hypothetical protein J6590_002306 [Homalodisca vitripennis]
MRVPPAISADVNERKTSLEIVPISKISNSRGADQKYKLNCNGKTIMYRAKNVNNHVMPRGLPRQRVVHIPAARRVSRNPLRAQ